MIGLKNMFKIQRAPTFLRAFAFLVGTLGIMFTFLSSNVYAANCKADGGTTDTQSTYRGDKMCIGHSLPQGPHYAELVVKLDTPDPNAKITFTNQKGKTDPTPADFEKIDDKTYVIKPSTRNCSTTDFEGGPIEVCFSGYGYEIEHKAITSEDCDPTGASIITVTINANGQQQKLENLNLCPEIAAQHYTIDLVDLAKRNQPPPTTEDGVCSTGSGLSGAVAWIICPFAQFAADVSVWLQDNFIKPYLTVSPLTTDQNSQNVVYPLWKSFRDLANVMLVIAFFAVIFSQATSIGISNYGIKKMLPRLVVVAVGANLSFFIIAFIIDAFNIFGAGVDSLTVSVVNAALQGQPHSYYPSTAHSIFVVVVPTIVALIIKAGPVLRFIVGILAAILLLMFVIVVALVIRQMLIIMLVVLSAPAIVAYLLPNTEQFYKTWQKWLMELLAMYPIIILFLAVGKIMGVILATNVRIGGG